MKERRKFMRFSVPVDVKYGAPVEDIEGLSMSRDVSREGISFPVNKQMVRGTMVELEMDVPGEIAPIFAQGEVAWVKESAERGDFDAGLKVARMNPFDRSRLLEYVYKEWLKVVVAGRDEK